MGKASSDRSRLEVGFAGLLSFGFLFVSGYQMLPVVMQDEYVYRSQTVYSAFSSYDYPGYLFGTFAKVSELSPDGFYSFIKFFNSLAAGIAAVVLYFVLQHLHGRLIALIGLLTFLFAPGMFQASFYMPDMFLSSFLLASVSLALLGLHEGRAVRDWVWTAAGLFLLLAFLSKPHALIAVLAFALFATLQTLRERRLSPVFLAAGIAFVGRLAVGVVLAGASGLNVFGRSYTEGLFSSPSVQGSLTASGMTAATSMETGVVNPAWSFVWEFLQLFSVFVLFTFGLLIVLLGRANRTNSNLFLVLVTISTLGAIALFETLVGIQGDDHSGRILTRHVEYLLPLLLAFGIVELKQFRPSPKFLLAAIPMVLALSGTGLWILSSLPMHRVSDGAIVLLSGGWAGGYLFSVGALALVFWVAYLAKSKAIPLVTIFGLAVVSISVGFEKRAEFSESIAADLAGKELAALGALKDREVLVISGSKADAELVRFYTLPAISSQRIVVPGSIIDAAELEKPGLVLLLLESIQLVSNCEPIVGEHFVYYDCDNLR